MGGGVVLCTSYEHTANEKLMIIQYKCLVLIYEFPEMKMRGLVIQVPVSDLNILKISLAILLEPHRQTNPGNI
jgi:hypothetical protein